jgi:hypothetical protein
MVWGVAQDYPSQTNATQASQATPRKRGRGRIGAGLLERRAGLYLPLWFSAFHGALQLIP